MKTIFCTFLDSRGKNGAITIKPIGQAKNKVSKPMLPGWKDVVTEIVIDKNYAKGLDGIEDYSHVTIVSGTPILDIKPYASQYDKVSKVKIPDWVNKLVF